ncbi:MAG: hypothetical protein Q7S06_03200 [Nanoarchaeota archaeon]|nr:hypothetical protein [Nanoarchaeota archaeon]
MKTKKAELTTQQLVMIIILVLSFAIILFFIFRLGLGGTADKEICHDSVVKKSSPVLGKLSGEFNCKTGYTCISGGGQCDEITVKNTINANNKDEIYKAIAEEMANCWWMFGEGKLDYGAGCSICSQIDFDDKIEEKYKDGLSYKEFLDSLAKPMNVQKSNDNYLYYLYGVSNLNSLFALDKYSLWGIDYQADTKISLQGKFIIATKASGKQHIAPQFPLKTEQISTLECGGNFLTKG